MVVLVCRLLRSPISCCALESRWIAQRRRLGSFWDAWESYKSSFGAQYDTLLRVGNRGLLLIAIQVRWYLLPRRQRLVRIQNLLSLLWFPRARVSIGTDTAFPSPLQGVHPRVEPQRTGWRQRISHTWVGRRLDYSNRAHSRKQASQYLILRDIELLIILDLLDSQWPGEVKLLALAQTSSTTATPAPTYSP